MMFPASLMGNLQTGFFSLLYFIKFTELVPWELQLDNATADVRTQAMYQLLDSGFVGLIFSCFNEDSQKVWAKAF